MTRADLAAWLGRQFAPIMAKLTPAITGTDDTIGGVADALDNTLLMMGYAPTDVPTVELTTNTQVQDARALARYYALELFRDRLLQKTTWNMGRGSLTEEEGKLLAQVERAMHQEAVKAAARNYIVGVTDGDTSVGVAHIDTDAFATEAPGSGAVGEWTWRPY